MNRSRTSEKGIVLVASLLSLLVVSLVVTAMVSTSGSETQMAFNSQSQNQTFQAAESGVDFMLTNTDLIYDARDVSTGLSSVQTINNTTPRLNGEAFSRYMGEGIPLGYSLGEAKTLKFEVEARGYVDDNSTYDDADDEARTELIQGLYRIIFTDG